MTNVPDDQTLAEAARRYAIATLCARLDEIAAHARRGAACEAHVDEDLPVQLRAAGPQPR
jgi:hypothetical protein